MRILLTLGFSLLLSAPVQSAVIISNLGSVGNPTTIDAGFEVAAGFAMPAGTSYNLTSATISLQTIGNRSIIGNNISIRLFGSSGGNPVGPALIEFTHPADFANTALVNRSVTPLTSFVLLPLTTYWLVLILLPIMERLPMV